MAECKWYDVSCGATWLRDEMHHFALWLYESLLGGLASMFEAIPVPGFFASLSTIQIPPGVGFFASAFEIPAGLAIITSAYVARFFLRRIPVIG
ncbi:MAG TPA: hypothetical protein VL987_12185 [Cellvibrio sp.]|nr:hypothetical protein [Cellvibrio sp.]